MALEVGRRRQGGQREPHQESGEHQAGHVGGQAVQGDHDRKYHHREAPAFGARGFQLSIPGTPTGGPFGKNAMVYHDELVTAEIGQIGTQFDGPGHIGVNTSKGR